LDPIVNDAVRGSKADEPIPAETIGALVWLLTTDGLDRRRDRAVNRLRTVRDSDQFATLPEDLRERVREILAKAER
jgi:hypothetical protein